MKYIALWLITAALLIGHSSLYYPYIADDAYISMRYAERFMQAEQIDKVDEQALLEKAGAL